MESVSSQVMLVSANLRPEETIVHIKEALSNLLQVSNHVYSQVVNRINETHRRLDSVSTRVKSAQDVIDQIAGNSKALKIFSSATYPVESRELGFSSLKAPSRSSNRKPNSLPRIKQPYSSVDRKRLQEKLNLYHVGAQEKRNGAQHASKRSAKYQSLSEAFFFMQDLTSSHKEIRDQFDIVSSFDWHSSPTDAATPLLGEAPPSIVRRGQMRQVKIDDLHYHPQVPEHPEIELPPALPDLPGIAENFDAENVGPTFAPVPSLPDLSSLLVPEEPARVGAAESVEELPFKPVEATVTESTVSLAPTPAPPPPPPPLPTLVLPTEEKRTEVKAAAIPPPAASGPALDMHSSLMEAIRKAGGSGKAKLKAVSDQTSKAAEVQSPDSSVRSPKSGPGDLMADLMAKLSTRRKGISGPRPNAEPYAATPVGVFDKVSSLISSPPMAPVSDDEGEDVWND